MDAVKGKKGMFYAVGVGPGDPMWMTREACAVLEMPSAIVGFTSMETGASSPNSRALRSGSQYSL